VAVSRALSATVTSVSALETMIASAPEMQRLLLLPLTEPASACAPSSPLYSPSMFWVSCASAFRSPSVAVMLPPMETDALFALTETATPTAIELLLEARLIATPVPRVLKLPSLSARMPNVFAVKLPETSTTA
jgi:hypothetical protein